MSRIPDICGRLLGSTFALSVLFGCSSTPSPPNFDAGVGSAGAASGGSAGDTGGGGASGGSAGATGNSGGSSGAGGGTAGAGGSGAAGVFDGPFALGVDISSVPEAIDGGATFADTDGTAKGLLEILGAHGFNYVRLRAFVEPWALYGYANPTGDAVRRKPKPYCDTDQTAAFAQEVKAAGMGFLLNLHYSDNWADPGKQVIPEAWRDAASIADMAGRVRDYTEATVQTMVDAGARPDMVQVGNEITPGMLIHVPSEAPDPDPWGNIDKVENTVSGSIDNWDNLATLLKAGIEGVKSVDPSIRIMLHVENTKHVEGVEAWVQQARSRGVEFDVLGLSCYTTFQGEPSTWRATFTTLAATFPELSFAIAEYNPERTEANEIMHDLPDGRGLGTFFWEPTQSGVWGSAMFTWTDGVFRANTEDFAEFATIRQSVGL